MSIWIMILLEVLKNLPTIIKVVKDIADAIKQLPKAERKMEMRNLAFATQAAKKERNFKPLERLRCRLLERCGD